MSGVKLTQAGCHLAPQEGPGIGIIRSRQLPSMDEIDRASCKCLCVRAAGQRAAARSSRQADMIEGRPDRTWRAARTR